MLRNADRFRRGSRFKLGRRFRRIDRKPDQERKEEQSENFQDGWKSRAVLFLVSQCITLFGSTLVQMAVVWYVTLETGSGVWVSAVSVSSYLPQFLISFPGGVWADRRNRKWLIIGADAATAAVTLLLIWLLPFLESGSGEGREGWILAGLLLMSVLRSAGAGVQTPAVNAVIPQLVPEEQLMRFNGLNAAMQSLVQFAAPAAAGALLTLTSLRTVLWVDVVTAAVGIGLLACVHLPAAVSQRGPRSGGTGRAAGLREGIAYVLRHKRIKSLLLVYGLFVFFCVPAGFLAGLLVSRVYGDTYGYLTAVELAGFAGMAAGGLLMSLWGGFGRREKTLSLGLAAFGLASALMGITEEFGLYLILMAFYGVALTVVQTAVTTLLQEQADRAVQGRIFGMQSSMYAGFLPLGMAVFGPLADVVPLQWIMIGAGGALAVLAALTGGSGGAEEEK